MELTILIPRCDIIIHSSLMERLIDERKSLFSNFVEQEKENGKDVNSNDWIYSTVNLNIDDVRSNKSRLEEILFNTKFSINSKYLNAPDSNGEYHIIRLVNIHSLYSCLYVEWNAFSPVLPVHNKHFIQITQT